MFCNICLRVILISLLHITTTFAVEPENGWWWSPARSGNGLDLELQGNILLVGYFAEVNGERIAYNGFCSFDGTHCSGEFLAGINPTGVFYTLSFPNDAISGNATIASDSFAIERFQFTGFGAPPTNLIGSWIVVTLSEAYTEALVLSTVEILQNGTTVLSGVRDGTSQRAVASYFADDDVYAIAVEDTDTTIVVYVLDQRTGLNTMMGTTILTDLSGNPLGDTFDAIATRFTQNPVSILNSKQQTSIDTTMTERLLTTSTLALTQNNLSPAMQQIIQTIVTMLNE